MSGNFIEISAREQEFSEALRLFERMEKAITPGFLKSTQRRNLQPMVNDMQGRSKSARISQMIGITTAKRRSGPLGSKVGVVKNDEAVFPTFSAQGLAAVIEYGTDERFRQIKSGPLVTGRQSTGSIQAEPFLRPAWDANVGTFMDKTEHSVVQKVMREAKRG